MECEDEPVSRWTTAGRDKARATLNARTAALTDEFAERLANGAHPHDAAQSMGLGKSWGDAALRRVRQRLGAQAC